MTLPTALVYGNLFLKHVPESNSHERKERCLAILAAIKNLDLLYLEPRIATFQDLMLCHSFAYISKVEKESLQCPPNAMASLSTDPNKGDTLLSSNTFDIACLSAGAVLTAVDAVLSGTVKNAFCLVRPPGHHASAEKGWGFCFFNNVAVGAKYAQSLGMKRVLIIDWDGHHCDGTEKIFKGDDTVAIFSTFEGGCFPNSGDYDPESKTKIFIPIQDDPNARKNIMEAFTNILVPMMREFQPNLVMISCGFDGKNGDLCSLNLRDEDFRDLTRIAMKIAKKYSKGRVISVFEGGYNLEILGSAAKSHIEVLIGND